MENKALKLVEKLYEKALENTYKNLIERLAKGPIYIGYQKLAV